MEIADEGSQDRNHFRTDKPVPYTFKHEASVVALEVLYFTHKVLPLSGIGVPANRRCLQHLSPLVAVTIVVMHMTYWLCAWLSLSSLGPPEALFSMIVRSRILAYYTTYTHATEYFPFSVNTGFYTTHTTTISSSSLDRSTR